MGIKPGYARPRQQQPAQSGGRLAQHWGDCNTGVHRNGKAADDDDDDDKDEDDDDDDEKEKKEMGVRKWIPQQTDAQSSVRRT